MSLWVCPACGREGPSREKVGDESCYIWATEVDPASIERADDGRILSARAVSAAVLDSPASEMPANDKAEE